MYDADFIFNIPSAFDRPVDFANWLNKELGLSLALAKAGESWHGPHLGLFMDFKPRHGAEPEPGLPYDRYLSSIGLTGYGGQGDLRVIMLSAVINIALAMCFRLEIDGIVIWDDQVRISHLGMKPEVEGELSWLWDFDRDIRIRSFEDLKPIISHGVEY